MKKLIRKLLREFSTYEDVMNILSGRDSDIKTIGIITAWNPQSTKTDDKYNARIQLKLKKELRKNGYDFIDIVGQFGNPEESILIKNIPKQHLVYLGSPKKYNQSSVIFGKRVGRKMVFEYLEDGMVVERMDVLLGKDDEMVKTLTDLFSVIKNKRFKVPFFTKGFSYPEEEYVSDVLKSKKMDKSDIKSYYLYIINKMMSEELSPIDFENHKKIFELYFEDKSINFIEKEFNRLQDEGMSGENLALIFGDYNFF